MSPFDKKSVSDTQVTVKACGPLVFLLAVYKSYLTKDPYLTSAYMNTGIWTHKNDLRYQNLLSYYKQ